MFMNYSFSKCQYGKNYYYAFPKCYSYRSFSVVRKALNRECLSAKVCNRSNGCIFRSFSNYLLCRKRPIKLFTRCDIGIVKSLKRLRSGGKGPNEPAKNLEVAAFLLCMLSLYFLFRYVESATPEIITWETFVQELLSKGEVDKIVLHEDFKFADVHIKKDSSVKWQGNYGKCRMYVQDVKTFEDDLKAVEDKLGIPPGDGVLVIHSYGQSSGLILRYLVLLFILYLLTKSNTFNMMNPFEMISKAKYTLVDPLAGQTKGVKFSDVGGLREAKQEIMEFVDYLKRPEHYKDLGAKVPKGALLLGPPGCGKTLLAKAVASEANVPFLSMNGSEFIELIGGLGAARVRDLFSDARNISPCIIYIDEIDAIGKKRSGSSAFSQSHSEVEHTLNQLLVEMDGMASREGVVTLASTNRAEVLDSALLRPGRFDRHIMIDLPNLDERREIFVQHMKGIHLEHKPEYYAKRMASLTPGFSGADIANVCNEAALHAARFKKGMVKGDDLEYAVERVVGGTEKRSSAISPEEKHLVAYHEAGRALVGWLTDHGEILVKMSVVPRTHQSVGWTQFSAAENYLFSEEELFDKMCMALGGRVAESLIFNKVSTKSEKDLRKVTRIAYAQVRQYGMNKIVGPLSFPEEGEYKRKPYSKQLGALIDQEARRLVSQAFLRAEIILRENKDKLVKVAEELLRRETMNYSDVVQLIGPPKNSSKKSVEPLIFDLTIDMVAGPEPPSEGKHSDET